jgi:hypothetical protein
MLSMALTLKQSIWVKDVVFGPEKPVSAIKNGKLIWPSDTSAKAVEVYDKSVLEDWANQLQGIKQAENDEATPNDAKERAK